MGNGELLSACWSYIGIYLEGTKMDMKDTSSLIPSLYSSRVPSIFYMSFVKRANLVSKSRAYSKTSP
jgi:hypothetical protein